jgi:hypothetical protein
MTGPRLQARTPSALWYAVFPREAEWLDRTCGAKSVQLVLSIERTNRRHACAVPARPSDSYMDL